MWFDRSDFGETLDLESELTTNGQELPDLFGLSMSKGQPPDDPWFDRLTANDTPREYRQI